MSSLYVGIWFNIHVHLLFDSYTCVINSTKQCFIAHVYSLHVQAT